MHLGHCDSDQNAIIDGQLKLCFTVNSGADCVTMFYVREDGTLSAVSASPFPCGGVNPAIPLSPIAGVALAQGTLASGAPLLSRSSTANERRNVREPFPLQVSGTIAHAHAKPTFR